MSGKLDILCEAQKAGCMVGAGMHRILDSTGSVRSQNKDHFNEDFMFPFEVKEVCFSLPIFPVTLLLFFDHQHIFHQKHALNLDHSQGCLLLLSPYHLAIVGPHSGYG